MSSKVFIITSAIPEKSSSILKVYIKSQDMPIDLYPNVSKDTRPIIPTSELFSKEYINHFMDQVDNRIANDAKEGKIYCTYLCNISPKLEKFSISIVYEFITDIDKINESKFFKNCIITEIYNYPTTVFLESDADRKIKHNEWIRLSKERKARVDKELKEKGEEITRRRFAEEVERSMTNDIIDEFMNSIEDPEIRFIIRSIDELWDTVINMAQNNAQVNEIFDAVVPEAIALLE